MGFSFVEIGSVSPAGSGPDRETRLERVGSKTMLWDNPRSEKIDVVEKVLDKRLEYVDYSTGRLGINLGTNGARDPRISYRMGIQKLLRFADYFVVNYTDLHGDK